MEKFIKKLQANLNASIEAKTAMLHRDSDLQAFGAAIELLVKVYRNGGRLYIAGNGGSAADAQHLAAEFVAKLAKPRAPMPAEALTVDTSTLTAIGNDFGFEELFARQLQGKATSSDAFLALTTSGQSRNIVRALETCKQLGVPSIVFSGHSGGIVRELADYCVIAPGSETSQIQEVHMVLYHTLCGCVETELFG